MKHTQIVHECCPVVEPLPQNIRCFAADICENYRRLGDRYERKFAAPKECFISLSQPLKRVRNTKFIQKCPCRFKRNLQLIYLEDAPYPPRTRTEQLALPYSWRLALSKERVKELFTEKRMTFMDRLLRKSYLSVYSRLANAYVPPYVRQQSPEENYTTMNENQLERYLTKLAEPKTFPEQPKIEREKKSLNELTRFHYLANPKYKEEYVKPEWVFTPNMKNHKASQRTKDLAVPKERPTVNEPLELPLRPSPESLKYKASPRIREIAEPKALRKAESDLKDNPFSVAPNALKFRTTARLKTLAEPKEFENKHIRPTITAISPTALTYNATPRIIKLAEPKERS